MKLSELLQGLDCALVQGSAEIEVSDVVYDTRRLVPGAVFVCIVGTSRDSHSLAAEAVERGAAALVIQHDIPMPGGVCVVRAASTRRALALMSANYFGHPARQMTVIGVTGTKGKTTTAHMIRSVLEAAGRKTGIIGTNGVAYMQVSRELPNTTRRATSCRRCSARCWTRAVTAW